MAFPARPGERPGFARRRPVVEVTPPARRLSRRLAALRDLVPAGASVADVGSGHGQLAEALAAAGHDVVATERTPERLARLERELGGGGQVRTRWGDGLAALSRDQVEVAVIAGMGGRSVVRILSLAAWLPATLLLQPMQDAGMVEAWVGARGWPVHEVEVLDRGRRYRAWRVDVPPAARFRATAA
jgi:tRNA (adenine22-N1)-methyltransferase